MDMDTEHTRGQTKKDAVREYLAKHQPASNDEAAEALQRDGWDINKRYVSCCRHQLGLSKPRSAEGGRTILRPPNQLKRPLMLEMLQRGGRVVVGLKRTGADRDIYVIVAEAVGVTEKERQMTIGEIKPEIFQSQNRNAEQHARRNAWDYTMTVAVQQLKDHRWGGPFIRSVKRGVWEFTPRGYELAKQFEGAE
jgi:hypothetical protein